MGALEVGQADYSEADFSAWELPRDRWRGLILVLLPILPIAWFAWSDFLLHRGENEALLAELLAVRIGFVTFSLACAWIIWRTRHPTLLAGTALVWALSFVCAVHWVALSRPPEYTGDSVANVLIVYGLYVLVPGRTWQVALPGLLLTVGDVWLTSQAEQPLQPLTRNVIVGAYVYANLLGVVTRTWIGRSHHSQFDALQAETEVRRELEAALTELRTLRGILPICFQCKRIRDDEGYWQAVDVYVTHHSEAEFTHGLCPECSKHLYPEYADGD